MSRSWVFFILLVIISIVFYIAFTEEKDPKVIKTNNGANLTGNILQIDSGTYIQCPDDEQIKPSTKNASNLICFNPAPFGHMIVTTPQMMAFLFTIAICGVYTIQGKRDFYSSKILPFGNKYQEGELKPISKMSQIHKQKGFVWTRKGYDYIFEGKDNEFYVSKEDMAEIVGKHLIPQGELLKISHQALFIYLNRDLNLLREVLEDPKITVTRKGKVDNYNPNIKIFIPVPMEYRKAIAFSSIKGHYDFNADRFDIIIRFLFKMRDGLSTSYTHLVKANKRMLEDVKSTAEGSAVISRAYRETQDTHVVDPNAYQQPEQAQRNSREEL